MADYTITQESVSVAPIGELQESYEAIFDKLVELGIATEYNPELDTPGGITDGYHIENIDTGLIVYKMKEIMRITSEVDKVNVKITIARPEKKKVANGKEE